MAAAGQQRPHDEEGGPHLAHEVIRRLAARNDRTVYEQGILVRIKIRPHTELAQNLGNRMYILQCRNLFLPARDILSQQRSCYDWQHRIFGSTDLYPALERMTAIYD